MPIREKAPEDTTSKAERKREAERTALIIPFFKARGEKKEKKEYLLILPTFKDSYEGIKSIVKSLGSPIFAGIKSLGSSIYNGCKNLSNIIKRNLTPTPQDRGKEGMVKIPKTSTLKELELQVKVNHQINAYPSGVIPASDLGYHPRSRVDKPKPKTNPTNVRIVRSPETETHGQQLRFTRLTTPNSIGKNTGGGGRER